MRNILPRGLLGTWTNQQSVLDASWLMGALLENRWDTGMHRVQLWKRKGNQRHLLETVASTKKKKNKQEFASICEHKLKSAFCFGALDMVALAWALLLVDSIERVSRDQKRVVGSCKDQFPSSGPTVNLKWTWAQPTGWPLSHWVPREWCHKMKGIPDKIQTKGTKFLWKLVYIHHGKSCDQWLYTQSRIFEKVHARMWDVCVQWLWMGHDSSHLWSTLLWIQGHWTTLTIYSHRNDTPTFFPCHLGSIGLVLSFCYRLFKRRVSFEAIQRINLLFKNPSGSSSDNWALSRASLLCFRVGFTHGSEILSLWWVRRISENLNMPHMQIYSIPHNGIELSYSLDLVS